MLLCFWLPGPLAPKGGISWLLFLSSLFFLPFSFCRKGSKDAKFFLLGLRTSLTSKTRSSAAAQTPNPQRRNFLALVSIFFLAQPPNPQGGISWLLFLYSFFFPLISST